MPVIRAFFMTLASLAAKAVHPACVERPLEVCKVAMPRKAAVVIHARELGQLELVEHLDDLTRLVDPVCVELGPRPPYRKREQQGPPVGHDALEFGCGTSRPERVQWIAVAPEADVLGDMQTRDRAQRAV